MPRASIRHATRVDTSCSGLTRASRAATPLLSTDGTMPEPADPRVEPEDDDVGLILGSSPRMTTSG
jgi:hypothetical protein